MPLAPPLRLGGALLIMARTFGAWKNPNPAPHTAMRQMISVMDGADGSRASRAIPAASTARPMPSKRPGA